MPTDRNARLGEWLKGWRVLPVVRVGSTAQGLSVAEACLRGGLEAIEITLRTPAALDAIAAVARRFPSIAVGAGSVLEPEQMLGARQAGARFTVSPGFETGLAEAAVEHDLPWLPGVATASEVMAARRAGFRVLKYFPAASTGGVAALRQLAGPFTDVRFCPTGGIDAATMPQYLALPNVLCVGGSWITDDESIAREQWDVIASRAAAARTGASLNP